MSLVASTHPETSESFWKALLSSVSAPTPLLDDTAPARALPSAAQRELLREPVPRSELAAWQLASDSMGVCLETLLAGAWALVLSVHSRESLVLFGEALTGIESTLPALVAVPQGEAVASWLRAIEASREERTANADLDAEALHRASAVPAEMPLFESLLVLDATRWLTDSTLTVPLSMALTSEPPQLSASFASARLSASTVERALRHLRTALNQLATLPAATLGELTLLSEDDLAQLSRLNDTSVSYPEDVCLHRLIEEQAERSPDAPAVISEQGELSYAQLNRRANQLAHRLRGSGVRADSLVGIFVERSLEMVVGLLGILKAGGAYVPLDPSYPGERIRFMLDDAKPPLVLVTRDLRDRLPAVEGRVLELDDPSSFGGMPDTNPEGVVDASNLAYVIFTSGSTGRPKGSMNEHRAIVNRLLWMQDEYRLTPDDRILQKTPFSFDVSVWEFFWPLLVGAKLVMARPGGHKDSSYLVRTIREHGVTTLHFVPSMLQAFLHDPDVAACTGIQRVICSGEALTVSLASQFFAKLGAELHNLYGPTEAAVDVTYWACDRGSSRVSVPIGHPVANTQIHILDSMQRPLPVGVPGELHIGGVQVGRGYFRRAELTAEKFIADPFSARSGARMYRTGDLARVTEGGLIEYLGRLDSQVKLRGFRIELGEIEAVLSKQASVARATVILRRDREEDPRLVAYLVGKTTETPSARLRESLAKELPEFMVPAAFVWLESLPLSPSGKLDTRALPAPSRERPDTGHPVLKPRTDRERLFCSAFSDVLEIHPVGAEDGFFELGGNSLLAIRLLSGLREAHGIDIPVAWFFQHPTPRALSARSEPQPSLSERDAQKRRRQSSPLPTQSGADEAIAIVGMAGRFPGARDVAQLWQNVCAGTDSITHFAPSELDPSLSPELVTQSDYVRARGVIDDYDKFDAPFFGISPRDAELLDPQQRLFLEAAWEALENAGYVTEAIQGLVGVYAGMYSNTYLSRNLHSHPELEDQLGAFALLVQNEKDYIATRVAHRLDLRGPALSVNTACSTSLVAVVEAYWSLRNRRCDVALAGGASVTCPPRSGYLYVEGGMLSVDGRTRSFDANATGTTFNDGVGVVVLKRLADALADRDTVYAVIRGAASNNDGGEKASFTAPSIEGQAAVIRMAQTVANLDPRTIGYIEAHGTATPIGDPIEVEALTMAFRECTQDRQFCALSSVKSNIGHLVAAAGVAGLIKAALCLKHGVLAPTAHFKRANPAIAFDQSPFYVVDSLQKWPTDAVPRRAGVSAFGVGGTNAHVVMEQAPEAEPSGDDLRPHLLLVSARNSTTLDNAMRRLAEHLQGAPETTLGDVAYTLACGRRSFPTRRALVALTASEAATALSEPDRLPTRTPDGHDPSVVFLFPGQGAQYPGMGHSLYRDDPAFRAIVDQAAEQLAPALQSDLRSLLYGEQSPSVKASDTLKHTLFTQPALFVVEYAMAQVLLGWGVRPAAMIGHSVGEFVCAVLAGVMSFEDALNLVATRGRMMQGLPRGSMLSVRLSSEEVTARLPRELAIASNNGPSLCVVSGPTDSVESFQAELESAGVMCRMLLTSHAFHSPMMDPVVEPFTQVVSRIRLRSPQIPFVSTLTGTWILPEQARDPRYWAKHLRQTVRYAEAVREVLKSQHPVLVEVGPRATLTTLARQQADNPGRLVATPTLGDSSEGNREWTSVLSSLGQMWSSGVAVDWDSFYAGQRRQRIALPSYPFERRRFWIDPAERSASSVKTASTVLAAATVAEEPSNAIPDAERAGRGTKQRDFKLCAIMEAVSGLKLTEADGTASLTELGLDSLALTQVAQHIQRAYGVRITMRELVESRTTLNTLSDHLAQRCKAQVRPPFEPIVVVPESTEPARELQGVPAPLDARFPPVPGARLGRDREGNAAWFVPDPERPGKYVKLATDQ